MLRSRSMRQRWHRLPAALFLVCAACVSVDAVGVVVPDISGTYAARILVTAANDFEVRTDTVQATLQLRQLGSGNFTGSYAIAPSDSGPFGGLLSADSTIWLTTFGSTSVPMAGVATFRAFYSWCDFTALGAPLTRGTLSGDSLRASVTGAALPCLYQIADSTLTLHTNWQMQLDAARIQTGP